MTNPTIPENGLGVSEAVLSAAIRCDLWADDMHDIVEAVNAASDAGDLSTEQCVALGVLLERQRTETALARRFPADNAVAFERELAEGVLNRLGVLTVGTCSCNTMTPELKHHAEACRYRIAAEALDLARPLLTATPSYAEGRAAGRFKVGDRVRKIKGSSWQGIVVGTYSTTLTPEGYAIESEREPGSVQIYPAAAIEALIGAAP